MNSRHRTSSPASPAAPLDDDDLLREILLRLPPQPSSLPRASLVCTRWRDFVADAGFLRLFRVHHRKAPPLGFLTREHGQVVFTPTLDPPDRIPAARFSWTPPPPPKIQVDCRYCQGEGWCFFGCHELQRERWSFPGCHHVLALLLNWQKREAIVWDPVTGHQRRVAFPLLPGFNQGRCKVPRNSAVVCAASDGGHVHGACHLSPFKFVLVCNDIDCKHAFVCLYESGSGAWGNIIEAAATTIDPCRPSVLVGDALCWLLRGGRILKFDHERQSLAVIDRPADAQVASYHDSDFDCFQILRIEDSVLGLAILFELSIHIWEIKSDCGGVVKWMLRKTIQLGELLCVEKGPVTILGYDEVTNMILLSSDSGDFMVQLESMWFKNISRREYKKELTYHPYSNFYTAVRLREQQKDQSESRKGPELSKGKKIADGKAECTMPDENTAQTTKPRNKVQTEAQSEKTTKVRSGSKRSSTTPIYIGTNQNASTSQQEANSFKKKKQVQSIKGNVSDNFEA